MPCYTFKKLLINSKETIKITITQWFTKSKKNFKEFWDLYSFFVSNLCPFLKKVIKKYIYTSWNIVSLFKFESDLLLINMKSKISWNLKSARS